MKTSVADVLLGTGASNGLVNLVQSATATSQKDLTNSFANTFNSTAGKSEEVNTKQTTDVKQTKTVVENKPVREVSEAKEQPKKESLEENSQVSAAKEIADGGKEVVEKIKEEFKVTDEAIEEAMQVLGINFQDLFNTEDLQKLIMEVTGTNDSIELITNDFLYKGIGAVTEFMNQLKTDISEKFGISEEAVLNIANDETLFENLDETSELSIEDKKAVDISKDMLKITDDKFDKESKDIENKTSNPENAEENPEERDGKEDDDTLKNKVEQLFTDNSKTQDKSEKADDKIRVEVSVENTNNNVSEKVVNTNETSTLNRDNQKESQNKKDNDNGENNLLNTTEFTTNTTTVGDVVEVVESYRSVENGQEVMRQITEHMKINISSDSTSMEMQLHPASLGTVNMQVISQNGQVTAHFTVQNEAVKAILETQMLSLQETLNEQGTKVSAIEVTVANYNLDKGSENQPNEGNSQNGKKGYGKRSSINLNGLDSFEDLDEEELIEAKVMEMNGNTVSYTV